MQISQDILEDIAGDLECGFVCYYHRQTGEIEKFPDPLNPYFEPEPWQDVIDKVEGDRENYISFSPMNSYEGYQVMENFALSLNDGEFKDRLFDALNRRKPFRNFKNLVDDSDFRQDWFDFKSTAYIEFVKQQIEEEEYRQSFDNQI